MRKERTRATSRKKELSLAEQWELDNEKGRKTPKDFLANCKACGKKLYYCRPISIYKDDYYCPPTADNTKCHEKLMARINQDKLDDKSGKGKKSDSRNGKRRMGNS